MAGEASYDELAPYLLSSRVIGGLDHGEQKGAGAYGAVYQITVNGTPCIAKRLHGILVNQQVSKVERTAIQQQFRRECVLLSKLKHPNIVHFIGVHYGTESGDISLIMEQLYTDLATFLEPLEPSNNREIRLSVKVSILLDVCYGLYYLHGLRPPVLHRDLSANNILLTTSLQAKIADLGVSKLFDPDVYARATAKLTKAPGSQNYMPPEALKETPKYDEKLDIFSFGHLTLYTVTEKFPQVHEVTITHEVVTQRAIQILKRRKALDFMGGAHPLYQMTIGCLRDQPGERPTIEGLMKLLKDLNSQHPMTCSDVIQATGEVEPVRMENDQLKNENEELQHDLDTMRRQAQLYKEDFQKERDDRAKAHGQKDEMRQQYLKEKAEMEDAIRKLQAEAQRAQDELVAHKHGLKDAAKQLQQKEHQVASVKGASDKAEEEMRTKALQVTHYKKKIDQLQDKLSRENEANKDLRVSMEEFRRKMEKVSAEIAGLRKEKDKLVKKMKKTSTGPVDEAVSLIALESKLANMEALYEAERIRSDDFLSEVTELRRVQREICEENTSLRELLDHHLNQQEIQEHLGQSWRSKGAGPKGQSTVSPTSPGGNYPSQDVGGYPQVLHDHHPKDLTAPAVRYDALHAQATGHGTGNQYQGQQHYHNIPTVGSIRVHPISSSRPQVRPDHLHVLSPTEAGTHASGEPAPHVIGSAVAVGGRATSSTAPTEANLVEEPHARKLPVVHQWPMSDIPRSSAYPQYGPPSHSEYTSLPLQVVPQHVYQQQGSREPSSGGSRALKVRRQQETRLASTQRGDMHKAAAEGLVAHQQPFESSIIPGDSTLDHRLDTMIHRVAGSVEEPTIQHIPYDPNLTCPLCYKQFRLGEIQVYRQHVERCN